MVVLYHDLKNRNDDVIRSIIKLMQEIGEYVEYEFGTSKRWKLNFFYEIGYSVTSGFYIRNRWTREEIHWTKFTLPQMLTIIKYFQPILGIGYWSWDDLLL